MLLVMQISGRNKVNGNHSVNFNACTGALTLSSILAQSFSPIKRMGVKVYSTLEVLLPYCFHAASFLYSIIKVRCWRMTSLIHKRFFDASKGRRTDQSSLISPSVTNQHAHHQYLHQQK